MAIHTETTGVRPEFGDRIIALAAVVIHIGPSALMIAEKAHYWVIDPGVEISLAVTEITSFTQQDLAGKPTFTAVARDIEKLLAGAVVVAHNLGFDRAFLVEEFRRAGVPFPATAAEVDSMGLSRRAFPWAKGHRLTDLCARLDIELDPGPSAGDSARAAGRCFLEMVRRQCVPDDLGALRAWARPDLG